MNAPASQHLIAQTNDLSGPAVILITLRSLHVVVRTAVFLATVTAGVLLVLPRRWTAAGSFIPESGRTGGELASLSGLAAQFGVTLGGGNAPPTAFYVAVLGSHELLGAIADHSYSLSSTGGLKAGTLADFYRSRGNTSELRRERAITRLSHDLSADFSLKTGIVDFRVTTRDPQLALEIANQALVELTTFNLDRRKTQAAAERLFTQTRRDEARGELRDAEDDLQQFLQRNRDYRNSPQLTLEFDRLTREVSLRQQLYTIISQAYEQARIEEVRDTPVFTILDQPQLPVKPDPRGFYWKVPIAFLLGGGLALLGVLVREAILPSTFGGAPLTAQLPALWDATVRDLWRPWRLFAARTVK